MEHYIVKETPSQINWVFRSIAGEEFSLAGYTYRLYYSAGRGRTLATGVTHVGNTLTWSFTPREQWKNGHYDLEVEVLHSGNKIITVTYPEAFVLVSSASQYVNYEGDSTAWQDDVSTINIVSSVDINRFVPLAPVIGSDGKWYIDGHVVLDDNDNPVYADSTIDIETDGTITVNKGRHNEYTITSLKTALVTAASDHSTAVSDHNAAVSDHNTAAFDHTTATSDHNAAVSDHSTAVSDHTAAASDHNIAVNNAATAATDHANAQSDHSTAYNDHTTALADHSTAVTDHNRYLGMEANIPSAEQKAKLDALPTNAELQMALNGKEDTSNKVTSWSSTPSDTNFPAEKLVKDSLDAKQATLVSGTNLKTINNESLLGSGNITIQGGAANAVTYTEQSLTGAQKQQARTNIGAGTYSKPSNGIPASDIASGVIPDVSQFITKSVNDLTNYYLKSETYTKEEVQQLISTIQGLSFEVVSVLPTASADTMGKIYLVPSADPQTQNVKDEYITIESSGSYAWEIIGSTSIDLSGYVTTTDLNTALADYTTTTDLTTLLQAKQDTLVSGTNIKTINNESLLGSGNITIQGGGGDTSDCVKVTSQSFTSEQQAQARTNIGAGTYSKPSGGIPSTDLASGIIPTVNNATLTVKMNNASKGTFTANASSDVEIDLGTVITSHQDISGKADKVSNATNGNFAGLDGNGNLTDSGHKHSDYLTSHQDISGKEDTSNKVSSWSSTTTDTHYPSEKLVKDSLDAKQAALVSGTNIKTINNESLLGPGNIDIQGGGISTITLTFTPNEGETYFGTKAQAATALGISTNEVDSLMAGDYDRLIFNDLYADKSTPGQVTSDAAYQRYVAADYNGVPYSLYLIYEDGGYGYWWGRQVPALSTSIYSDGNSNAKAATPKSVKDYIDDLPIPHLLRLGAFAPTESSSYISLGNASAAAASLNIEEEELYNLYDGVYNRLSMYDIATGKVRIAHDALRIDEGGGATYEMLAPDGTPYVLDFLYESSAYKYRYYSVVGDIATILASI